MALAIASIPLGSASARDVPRDLTMRRPQGAPRVKLLARDQAPPPDPGPAPTPAEPAPAPAPAPPEVTPAPPPAGGSPDQLSDEAMKKLMEEAQKNQKTEVITVHETGSLIERAELISPAPISVLSRSDIQTTGLVTTGDVLQKVPSQGGAVNSNFNNGGDGSTRVALRNLGSGRTLVLLNGRRVVSGGTGADFSVDLNSIPVAIIERIEVLKDGASAVYGSDAIGGVVNIITRRDFDGQEAAVQVGSSQRGDGNIYDVTFVTGAGSQKGNVIFSGGYSQQTSVFAGDRDFSKQDFSASAGGFDWAPTDAAGHTLPPAKTDTPGGSSAIPGGRLGAYTTDDAGNLVPRAGNALWSSEVLAKCTSANCTRDPVTGAWRNFSSKDVFNYQPDNYLFTPLERYNVYSQGTYKLGDKIGLFFEGMYMNRSSTQQLAPEPLLTTIGTATPISKASIYNPYGLDITAYRRRLREFGDRTSTQAVNTFRIVAGLDGELPENDIFKNWKWEASLNYGRTEASQKLQGNLILSRLTSALGPSYKDASGVAHCGTPTANLDSEGCVPLDLLSGAYKNAITPAMVNYVTFTGVSGGFNQQQTALATLHGPLFNLPNNGVISLAVGADYRREAGGSDPDPLTATGDTTGNQTAPVQGNYHVWEGFGELQIVPIANQEWARWVEANFAARAFDYNSFGSGVTWKAGGLFRTEGGFAVRGTYSSAFRAPSIADLYSGHSDNFPNVVDPCDLSRGGNDPPFKPLPPEVAAQCAKEGVPASFAAGLGQQREKVGGTPSLEAETAKTYTFGAVWEPPFVKGLSATLDYFHISIDKAIQGVGASIILNNCYSAKPTMCDQIHRKADSHEIDYIDDFQANLSSFDTSGLDFALAYDFQNKTAGHFRVTLVGTYLFSINEVVAGVLKDGLGVYDLATGGAGANPTIKTNLGVAWGMSGFNAGTNLRFVGSFDECQDNDCSVAMTPRRTVDSYVTADLFGGYTFKTASLGTTSFAVGVNNVMDATPPYIANGFYANSDAPSYDFIGRYFYTRLSQSF